MVHLLEIVRGQRHVAGSAQEALAEPSSWRAALALDLVYGIFDVLGVGGSGFTVVAVLATIHARDGDCVRSVGPSKSTLALIFVGRDSHNGARVP